MNKNNDDSKIDTIRYNNALYIFYYLLFNYFNSSLCDNTLFFKLSFDCLYFTEYFGYAKNYVKGFSSILIF
jgi:hypothetical protein